MERMQQARANTPFSKGDVPLGYVMSAEQFPVNELVEIGAAAEKGGFNAVWSSDHFQPWQDNEGHASLAWITLGAVGQRTTKTALGTGVTCPTFRYHPAIVAEAFATLGTLYPGRIFLGVGTGEALNEEAATGQWGDYEERAGRLIEAVQLIRQLWTGQIINHKGQYYQVKDAKIYDVPPQPVPIYIAAAGEKSMRLSGQYGDGLITDAKSAVDPKLRKAFEEGCQAAGKDPKTMPIIAEHWVIVGNEAEAKKYAPLWQFLPKAWDEFVNNHDPRDIQRKAQKEVKLEQTISTWAIGQDPKVHIDAIQKMLDQGVTQVFVHSPQPNQKQIIEFFSQKVLPHFRQGQGRFTPDMQAQPTSQYPAL